MRATPGLELAIVSVVSRLPDPATEREPDCYQTRAGAGSGTAPDEGFLFRVFSP